MKKSVLSLRQSKTTVVFLHSNCLQVLKSFLTDLLNIIFDDFGILFTDFWFEFSCLYIPQEHYFIVLSGYEVKMNM